MDREGNDADTALQPAMDSNARCGKKKRNHLGIHAKNGEEPTPSFQCTEAPRKVLFTSFLCSCST